MNYTTYLFDFDYTLADSSRGIVTCFHNVLTRHGYTEVTDDDIKRTIGKTLEDSFSILTGVTDAGQLAGFKAEYRKEADTHMTVNTVLFLETKSVLTALKDSGARIGIISTKYRFRIKELLNQHFPEDFMDIIVGGEDVKAAKPSPEGLLLAIKRLHVSKAETLYMRQHGRCGNSPSGRSRLCWSHPRSNHCQRIGEVPTPENNEHLGRTAGSSGGASFHIQD
jgi:phosphoglycolate phosphatase-like HAD superfamily hydrolase